MAARYGRAVMNASRCWIGALGLVLAGASHAFAGANMEPAIVVSGRPGVPVMINGQDARGAIVEGDWGLARPGAGVTVFWPSPLPDPTDRGRISAMQAPRGLLPGRFFPATGRRPRMGRDEVIPPADRPLPPRAESFQRTWRSESPELPANVEQPWYPLPLLGVDIDRLSRRHGPRQSPDR